jgi:hypothetical protein
MIADWHFYALAIPAVILLGLSKGGFAGMGALSLPLLAFAIDPVRAAAITLPILIAQDVVSVWAFRRTVDWRLIGWMLPGSVIGIWLGYAFAASVSPVVVMAAVGIISILFGTYRLWVDAHAVPRDAARWPEGMGSLFGIVSGFTSQIAHAGQPPFQLWVLPRNLPRDVLVGTTAIYFAATNWLKVPAYVALGQFSRANLLTSAALLPLALVSTLAGVWLVRRVSPERFYTAIYWLMILVGAALVWEATISRPNSTNADSSATGRSALAASAEVRMSVVSAARSVIIVGSGRARGRESVPQDSIRSARPAFQSVHAAHPASAAETRSAPYG